MAVQAQVRTEGRRVLAWEMAALRGVADVVRRLERVAGAAGEAAWPTSS